MCDAKFLSNTHTI